MSWDWERISTMSLLRSNSMTTLFHIIHTCFRSFLGQFKSKMWKMKLFVVLKCHTVVVVVLKHWLLTFQADQTQCFFNEIGDIQEHSNPSFPY